jgi:hypothetical protein
VQKTKPDPDHRKRAEKIVKFHLKQMTPTEISRRLELPQGQVSRELNLARKNWQEARLHELAETSKRQHEIDRLEQAFIRAWNRKDLPRLQCTDACATEPDAYLQRLETSLQLVRRRLRLRAAQSLGAGQPPTLDPIDELSEEEVDHDLARIAYELKLGGTKATS